MPNPELHKVIQIFNDKATLTTGNFTFTSKVTAKRDINSCVARCIEQATNRNLSGVIIDDQRKAG